MLSPTMITNSNGNVPRAAISCLPMSNCDCVPVPVSPITAKSTPSFCVGAVTAGGNVGPDVAVVVPGSGAATVDGGGVPCVPVDGGPLGVLGGVDGVDGVCCCSAC